MSKLSRRQALQLLGLATGGAGIVWLARFQKDLQALAQAGDSPVYLPYIARSEATATPTVTPTATQTATPTATSTPTLTPTPKATLEPGSLTGRVVHTRALYATNWTDPNTQMFYDHVIQSEVDRLFQTGLQQFTGQNTPANSWDYLFRRVHSAGYLAGQTKIAVKIDTSNSFQDSSFPEPNTCTEHNNHVDALPQVALALLDSLVAANVNPADVTFYDATGKKGEWNGKPIPVYFLEAVTAETEYPTVKFVGRGDCGDPTAPSTYGTRNASAQTVTFNPPNPDPNPYNRLKNRLLVDAIYDATFLINMPILKIYGGEQGIPVSLAMKNHLGSINYISDSGNPVIDNLNEYLELDNTNGKYSFDYSPLVDINNHPQIKDKTVLIVGDGLFGSMNSTDLIRSWDIFYGPGNSLFFATDPVAIDCVMTDLLRIEAQESGFTLQLDDPHVYDFLFCGEEAGLGRCEGSRAIPGGNPLQTPYGSGYKGTDNGGLTYIRLDI